MFPFQDGFLAQHYQNQINYNFLNQSTPYLYEFACQWNQQLQFFDLQTPHSIFDRLIDEKQLTQKAATTLYQQEPPRTSRKKLIKKLVVINLQRNMSQSSKRYKFVRKSLNYLDPSRAPPITTLRSNLELQKDLKAYIPKVRVSQMVSESQKIKQQTNILKLSVLIQAPKQTDYPFLICKKRKYYRNLKRRYSVAYFNERAYYISNKLQMPAQLQPKHKNQLYRQKKHFANIDQGHESFSDSHSEGISSQEYHFHCQSGQLINSAVKVDFDVPLKAEQVKRQTLSLSEAQVQ